MKRFFPVLLAVLLVVFSAVPAMASSSEHGISLTWNGDKTGLVKANIGSDFYYYKVSDSVFTLDDFDSISVTLSTGYVLSFVDGTSQFYSNGSDFVGFFYDSYYGNLVFSGRAGKYALNSLYTINLPEDGTYFASNVSIVYLPNATVPMCDGSSCPAVDVNFDNICDDCGNTFSVMRSYSWPALPSLYDGYNYFIAKNADGAYYLYFLDGTGDVVYDTTTGQLTPNATLHFFYADVGATQWRSMGSHASGSPFDFSDRSFQVSTVDILNEDGEPFFPPVPPLWSQVQGVTELEMPSLTQTTGGTMKILVLCGVGLMASLAVLSLFGKRSLISRR